jgi:hypothetical protein
VSESPQDATVRGSRARRLVRAVLPGPIRRLIRRKVQKIRYKAYIVRLYRVAQRAPFAAVRYMALGRELDNFTYEIANEDELPRFLEEAAGIPATDSARYIAELQGDSQLRAEIEAKLRGRKDRNRTMPYGRRLGWYAIARARKPGLIVETGVHDGLGSTVLLRALARNADEGHEGVLVSYDVNEQAGWLVPAFLKSRYELEFGPAPDVFAETLHGRPVDFFIHDSDHAYAHETAEFEAILDFAAPDAVLVSDNSHAGTAFRDLCERRGLPFHFFKEKPRHWYPGAGIGLAVNTRATTKGRPGQVVRPS